MLDPFDNIDPRFDPLGIPYETEEEPTYRATPEMQAWWDAYWAEQNSK